MVKRKSKLKQYRHKRRKSEKSCKEECILHFTNLENYGIFTSFASIKSSCSKHFNKIIKIRDLRLEQPNGSVHRIQSWPIRMIYHFLLKDIPQTDEYPPPDALFIQDGNDGI